jgi:hypothetical protein
MIEVEDVRREYSAVQKHKIINLCIRVQGKTDKTPLKISYGAVTTAHFCVLFANGCPTCTCAT